MTAVPMTTVPFTIQIADDVLSDLRQRLQRTRWPDEIEGAGWDYGTNMEYLQQLVAYWRERYDWRAQERLLNRFPQFQATVDGFRLHFIHVKGQGPRPLPLILAHGWPGSFFEFYKVVEPLADPARHGGSAEDAFDVVVPSLPGYGFSERPHMRSMNVARIADLFLRLMRDELGYLRFGAQGGDWGSRITAHLGAADSAHLIGIHLNTVFGQLAQQDLERLGDSPAIQRWRAQRQHYEQNEGAYSRIQGTRPQTLAYGLADSPVGLAGWIVEKFRAWSDCQGEVERAFTKDELLTNVMLYWVTNTINSSVRLYYEAAHTAHTATETPEHVAVPTGIAAFPHDITTPVRSLAERTFNIQHWSDMPAGGHFAALEQPEALVNDIRTFFLPLRQTG